ncbi:hypothetical protein BBO99_00000896 [Phytophthora kernoviae]|uniref:Uncharacterized protein n=1 Tax=Phytophthora kernoviae TaxID=325452 RepID=A0A3R7H9M7_9STRA|nr:hypothetical protein JM16_000774 [Phytophthora kernoviae]KAG2532950.1 hypothetical protein JM18_000857 [Phytophthora kernoviae]RLN37749.1 hypothetical protein BBI17_000798 [Phytophthora kernoviae]RLN84914.1 hypothetical protein BBO99_00000896 [Phytophthora kernoviae]
MTGETKLKSLSGMQQRAARNRAHNRKALLKLALFSILMFVVPLTTFFSAADMQTPGVLSVNIVIGLYILSAWKENDEKEVAPPVGRFSKAKIQ